MKKKLIGIPAFRSDLSFGCGVHNLEFVSQFGNARLIMPHEEYVAVDALYLPGGMDLNPMSYGEVPSYKAGNQDVFKQFFFDYRLDNYIVNNVPIFGVCAGFQNLAVKFGCKLTQNFKFHPQSRNRWEAAHEVIGSFLGEEYKFEVNSHHHQGVVHENFNESELEGLAFHPDVREGLIVEAFIHRHRPIAAVNIVRHYYVSSN